MAEFVVHGIPGSPFMRSVAMALEEKDQAYRTEAMQPGAARSEDYLKLHPFGRIPVVVHGDFSLYETQAILRYVDALSAAPRLQPSDARGVGRMNQIIGINDWYLFPQVSRVLAFQRIIAPALLGLAPDEQACAAAVPDARRCLGVLNELLGAQDYFAGAFSLADIHLAPHMDYLAMTPEGAAILQGTALFDWLRRMRSRPSMIKTAPPAAFSRAA